MVITVLKATFTKSKPNVVTYRDFKLFNEKKKKNVSRITNISSYYVFEKKKKSWGDMLQLKTKQTELIMHHMSQRLWEKQ